MQNARRFHLAEAGITIDMGRQAVPAPRVLLFDKNPLFCDVLSRQLDAPGLYACFGCSEADALLSEIARHKPDVLVLDPEHLGLVQGYEIAAFARDVSAASEQTRIIGYSFAFTAEKIRAALEGGFRGALSKSVDLARLQTALAAVLGGGLFLDESFGALLVPLLTGGDGHDGEPLSEREREVLLMIARGQGTKQIAYDLKISVKTVDTYKSRAVQKLGLKNRAELVDYAIAKGWMT
ncbi:MAG: response regulator transcription factor [Pseudomonadota bacterium]